MKALPRREKTRRMIKAARAEQSQLAALGRATKLSRKDTILTAGSVDVANPYSGKK